MDGPGSAISVLRRGADISGPRLGSNTSSPKVPVSWEEQEGRHGGQWAGLGEASSFLSVFILSVIMGSDTPRCLSQNNSWACYQQHLWGLFTNSL